MPKLEKYIYFLILVCILSASMLLLDIFDMAAQYRLYIRNVVFCSSLIMMIYYTVRNSLENVLTFIIIIFLFNPIYPVEMQHLIWKIVEFPVFFLFAHKVYLLSVSGKIKHAMQMALSLDQYFQELSHTISQMSYHQVSLYLKNHFDAILTEDGITWKVDSLKDVEFEVSKQYFSLGRSSRGGVTAKCLNEYKNIEIHQNFNLTSPVKNTVIEKKTKGEKTTYQGKTLKKILIHQYHYLEL